MGRRLVVRLYFTRRNFLTTGVGALATAAELRAQTQQIPVAAVPVAEYKPRSIVALTTGEDRRKTIFDAMVAIDDQIRPLLKTKKRVFIKANDVGGGRNPLACTHPDALRAILDYLAPRFKGPITIGEVVGGRPNAAAAGGRSNAPGGGSNAFAGGFSSAFDELGYPKVVGEYKSSKVDLVDLEQEGKFVVKPMLDQDAHMIPVHLAARFFDPDTFVIGAAMMKSHNYAVVTGSVKNMVLGAAARSDKVLFHSGYHLVHYDIVVTAQAMQPYWGLAVIDGHEGMEGNGPVQGTPVPSKLAIASTDFIAADRVAVECMGVDPNWVGYLRYCAQVGLGNYDRAKIDIRGPEIASVMKKYQMNADVDRQMAWMAPLDVEDGPWSGPKGRRFGGGGGAAGGGRQPAAPSR
jgi:uncharacterized protein (DUF362 family)